MAKCKHCIYATTGRKRSGGWVEVQCIICGHKMWQRAR